MTSYFEYGVMLTDGQKLKLASAIQNETPITLRLKYNQLNGEDELMLTKRQTCVFLAPIRSQNGGDRLELVW